MASFTLTNSWTNIGTGPVVIDPRDFGSVLIAFGAGPPASDADAIEIADQYNYSGTLTVWGKSDTATKVGVFPIGGGVGGSSDATAALQTTGNANIGATTEAVAATPGTASGLHGLMAGFWTAFIARIPAALGGTTSANSLPVVLSSDGPFATQTGSITETAPATDTASSGLNGRLQRIAQRLTTLLAGATSAARLLSAAASTNGTNVKASSGVVYAIDAYNAAATARFLKLYNKATTPTVGTDTPVLTYYMPPATAFRRDLPAGFTFATGIGYGITTAAADADTGALTAGDVVALNIEYA